MCKNGRWWAQRYGTGILFSLQIRRLLKTIILRLVSSCADIHSSHYLGLKPKAQHVDELLEKHPGDSSYHWAHNRESLGLNPGHVGLLLWMWDSHINPRSKTNGLYALWDGWLILTHSWCSILSRDWWKPRYQTQQLHSTESYQAIINHNVSCLSIFMKTSTSHLTTSMMFFRSTMNSTLRAVLSTLAGLSSGSYSLIRSLISLTSWGPAVTAAMNHSLLFRWKFTMVTQSLPRRVYRARK